MKRLQTAVLCSIVALTIFSGCKKDDKPVIKDCQVEEFSSNRNLTLSEGFLPVPYLFRKSLDENGKVFFIDAYVFPLGAATRIQAKIESKNHMVYLLDKAGPDTVMVIWLNNADKIIKAEEKSGFRFPPNSSGTPTSYQFTYGSDNRLQQYTATTSNAFPQTYTVSVTYDANGNCSRIGNTYFTYDLARTARKQFYFEDAESIATFWLGFKLLEYLNYFPEVTSPLNIRVNTKSLAGTYVLLETPLTDHQLDADGKLISYKTGPLVVPIVWNCGNTIKKQ
jgi:hypothetical protein